EEVDRDRRHAQAAQLERELDEIFVALPHPDDPAAAGLHPRLLDVADRPDAVLVVVRRADLREMSGAGFQVVVEAVDARLLEAERLLALEDAERGADADADRLLDLLHCGADGVELLRVRPARGG